MLPQESVYPGRVYLFGSEGLLKRVLIERGDARICAPSVDAPNGRTNTDTDAETRRAETPGKGLVFGWNRTGEGFGGGQTWGGG